MNIWLQSLFHLLFPPCCTVCHSYLGESKDILCLKCNQDLPRTNFHLQKDNPVEKTFWGKFPLGSATSFFYYQPGSRFKELLFRLKYKGEKEIGRSMGRMMAAELQESGFFQGIECIIPVPLHHRKLKLRGYNQSEWIAKGIAEITGIPLDTTSLVRLIHTETQTKKSRVERWENMEERFALQRSPGELNGRRILLVDDVLTTGATLTACASAFYQVKDIEISVLTMAKAEG